MIRLRAQSRQTREYFEMHWISHTNNADLFLSLNLTKLEDKFQIWEPEIVSENILLSQVCVTL